jgi:hypothetical protein
MAVDLSRLAGQGQQAGQQVMAGAQQLAGRNPVASAAMEALNNFAQVHSQYQAPLNTTPVYRPTSGPDPQTLQQISELMVLMDNHPVNSAGPNSNSPITNGLADGQAKRYAGAGGVLQGIWDNTMGAYIHTWQTNPEAALGMTAVGVGAMAATVLMPELAIPVWAGFALLSAPHILPQTVTSIADAAHNPTDANVTAALINIGTAAISIGSPIKAFRGIGAARAITNEGAAALQTQHTMAGAADTVLSLSRKAAQPGELKDARDLVDPYRGVEQFEVIPQTVDQLEQEITARQAGQSPVNLDDPTVERLRSLLDVHGQLQRQVQEAKVDLPDEVATEGMDPAQLRQVLGQVEAQRKLSAFEQQDLIPAQREFAHRYGYVLARENPMPRMTYEEVNAVDAGARSRVDRSFGAIWGVLHGAGDGHGWDGVSDGVVHADFAGNLSEAMARGMSGGGLEHAESVLGTELMMSGRRLGISDDRMEAIYRAIEGDQTHENPERYWEALKPTEKYLAKKLAVTFGIVTNYAYKHGHIELPLQRYVPRILRREGVEYAKQGNAFLRSPGNVESRSWVADDWSVANDMLEEEHHPTEDVSLRPLSDRLRQAVKTREQFQGGEDAKAKAFQQTSGYRAILRSGPFADTLAETKRMVGQRTKDLIPRTQEKIEAAASRISELERQIPNLDGQIRQIDRQLAPLKGRHGQAQQRDMLKSAQQDLIAQLRPLSRELKTIKASHADMTAKLATWQREVEQAGDRLVEAAGGDVLARDLLHMSGTDLRNIAEGKHPGGRQLLSGYHLATTAWGRFLRQMNQTRYREAWSSLAQTRNDATIKRTYGGHTPMSIQEINLMDQGERPIAIPGDLPSGAPAAMLEGYVQVMPQMGRDRGALNYQPAIYARADVAGRYKELAQQARGASDLKHAFSRGVYQATVGIPKKAIMASPAWHGKNVFGRYMGLLLDHPSAATSALYRVLKERMLDPEAYYQSKLDHWMDGGVPANRHNVHEQLNHLEQQMTGQRTFLSAMRSAVGALPYLHAQLAEGWFWKTVDDVGTAAYLTQKHRIMAKPWASERVAGMLAAEYANNVVGMVNPLYMSKLWKVGRQMLMFAPNWWTSFARMTAQAVPGSARISHYLAKHPSLGAIDPVKFHSLDIRQRKELVRMHRSYFLTYMAAGMAVHDMMNVILSGHHIWDNGKGHTWDLQTDLSHPAQGDPETEQGKHAYMTGDLFFAQMADLMNGIGLGHDWGFLHQMQGDGWKQADARQKIGIIGGALGMGLQRQAASKTGLPVQEAFGLGLGRDAYTFLRTGQAKEIPRTEALLGLLPAGTQAQMAVDDQRRLKTRLSVIDDPKARAQLQQLQAEGQVGGVPVGPVRGALKNQFIGLPSLYYTGDEAPTGYTPLTDSQMQAYLQQRADISNRKKMLSQSLFDGRVSPYDWVRQNQVLTTRHTQLLSDTFGESSAQGRLWQAYDALNKKYRLDDPNLSQDQFYAMLDARNNEWTAQLSAMSPHAQSVWWDAHTSTWTDADYLHYLSQQTKDAIAGAIDGQNGTHIRAMQNQLSSQGLPLTTSAQDALRQQDPYLWTYYHVLSQLGKNTLLGSVVSAFSNPFASFQVIPDEQAAMTDQLVQQGVLKPGTYVKQSTMQGLGQTAQALGQAAGPEGGRLAETPEGQALGRGLSAQEAQEILAANPKVSPQILAMLERIASGQ